MSGLSAGLATFNSCNKAGSIPHFTQHLSHHPNDYQALMWRGRAYSIIGQTVQARADFLKASRVSFASPKKNLAEAHINHIDGNFTQKSAILHSTVKQYPNCSEAWSDLGTHTYRVEKKVDLSLQYLEKASHLATMNSETEQPWFPWCNQTIGDIYYFEKHQLENAKKYYGTAVLSGKTLTIGYLGLSRCDILSHNLERGKKYFSTAKRLNPILVKWQTFDDFSRDVKGHYALNGFLSSLFKSFGSLTLSSETGRAEPPSSQQRTYPANSAKTHSTTYSGRSAVATGNIYPSLPSSKQYLETVSEGQPRDESSYTYTNASRGAQSHVHARQNNHNRRRGVVRSSSGSSSGRLGGSGSNGGSGDESGSDEEKDNLSPLESAAEKRWKKMKKGAPSAKKYRQILFYQSKCKNYWYSKIPPHLRHGNSFLKKYADKGKTLELLCSVDVHLLEMPDKHESGKFNVIKKSDMDGIF